MASFSICAAHKASVQHGFHHIDRYPAGLGPTPGNGPVAQALLLLSGNKGHKVGGQEASQKAECARVGKGYTEPQGSRRSNPVPPGGGRGGLRGGGTVYKE